MQKIKLIYNTVQSTPDPDIEWVSVDDEEQSVVEDCKIISAESIPDSEEVELTLKVKAKHYYQIDCGVITLDKPFDDLV